MQIGVNYIFETQKGWRKTLCVNHSASPMKLIYSIPDLIAIIHILFSSQLHTVVQHVFS